MKITNEIYQVGGGEVSSFEDAAIYLINFAGHSALVDAGCGRSEKKVLSNIRECGVRPEEIQYLLITHCHYDHTGGAKGVKEATKCQIVAHELDARFLEQGDDKVTAAKWYGSKMEPLLIDRKLSLSKEEIQLGGRVIEAIHTPGHSPGSVVYVTESERQRVVFAQDVHGPLDPSLLSNRDDYLQSLNLLISLEAAILCEGHYGVYKGKDEVKNFIRSFL
jgi:glyoxylase-like metal-dependent hydrolase (beta-lactamase superfamily II)